MIAGVEGKWGCVVKDHTESGGPDAAGANRPNFEVAPPGRARTRHGSVGTKDSILKIDNLAYLCI